MIDPAGEQLARIEAQQAAILAELARLAGEVEQLAAAEAIVRRAGIPPPVRRSRPPLRLAGLMAPVVAAAVFGVAPPAAVPWHVHGGHPATRVMHQSQRRLAG